MTLYDYTRNVHYCHLFLLPFACKEFTMGSSQSPRPTHVVTCFLLKNAGQAEKVLIVQRSQRVGSYHEHWAGISGFVEANVSPEEQAYTEIREETGLQREQVRLLKSGEIVEYVD